MFLLHQCHSPRLQLGISCTQRRTASANQSQGWSCLMSASALHSDACALHAGAKLDVQLMKQSKSVGSPSFCRTMVLRRLHGHVGPLQNLQYRFHLLQVCSRNAYSVSKMSSFLYLNALHQGQQCGKYSPGQAWLKLAAELLLTLCNACLMCRDCHSMLRSKQQLLLGDLNLR